MNTCGMNHTQMQGEGQESAQPHPKNGHIRLPNETVEQLARLKLSGSQWQILLVIWRRTLGWQKAGEWKNNPYPISLGDLAQATGLSRRHIVRQVAALTQINILRKATGTDKHFLSFNLNSRNWVVSKQSLVTKQTPGNHKIDTTSSGKIVTSVVTKLPPPRDIELDTAKKTPNKPINKQPKQTHLETAPPAPTRNKVKPYQVEAGIFLDLVEQSEDIKLINRGKAMKAARAIFSHYPDTTPETLFNCFFWLKENDSWLHNKEPPFIISALPDKYPAWRAGKLQPRGDETYGKTRKHELPTRYRTPEEEDELYDARRTAIP